MDVTLKSGRNTLVEGRSKGLSFAFAEVKNDHITALMPLSACKDFINDFVFTARHGVVYDFYGYSPDKSLYGYFAKKREIHMIVSFLANKYHVMDEKTINQARLFNQKIHLISQLVCQLEAPFLALNKSKQQTTTSFRLDHENLWLITFSPYWTQSTWQISLYLSFWRIALEWYMHHTTSMTDIAKDLLTIKTGEDCVCAQNIGKHWGSLIKGFPAQSSKVSNPIQDIHNNGIMQYMKQL